MCPWPRERQARSWASSCSTCCAPSAGPWPKWRPSSILFAAGVWAASVAERHWQRTDPGPVVIDEVVGMLITLLLAAADGPGRVRRVPGVPGARRVEAVAGGPVRVAARRPGRDGRRRDGRHLRPSADARPDCGGARRLAGMSGGACADPHGRDRGRGQRAAGDHASRHQLAVPHRTAEPRRHRRGVQGRGRRQPRRLRAGGAVVRGARGPAGDVRRAGSDRRRRDAGGRGRGVRPAPGGGSRADRAPASPVRGARLRGRDAREQSPAGDGAARRGRDRQRGRQRPRPVARSRRPRRGAAAGAAARAQADVRRRWSTNACVRGPTGPAWPGSW